jgi:hypothetical protein
MPWELERNRNSLSPHGIKEATGHGARAIHDVRCVIGQEPPPGLLGPTPLGATKSSPYMPQPAAREKPQR